MKLCEVCGAIAQWMCAEGHPVLRFCAEHYKQHVAVKHATKPAVGP